MIRWVFVQVYQSSLRCANVHIECLHLRDQRPYWFAKTKDDFRIQIEFNSGRNDLVHQYGCRSLCLKVFHSEASWFIFFVTVIKTSIDKSHNTDLLSDTSVVITQTFLEFSQTQFAVTFMVSIRRPAIIIKYFEGPTSKYI